MDIVKEFEKYDDCYLQFEDVKDKRSNRPDLHAFFMIDELDSDNSGKNWDAISASEHDEIWLSFDMEVVAQKITSEQVKDLIRCGVRIDDYGEGFAMFT